ncbi:MAG: shikimate dehydrogenase family protein [Bacteroidia bacterium]
MQKLYGLIGYPLTHSFSKKYFTEKFEKENIADSTYELFPIVSIDLLPQLIKDNPNLRGLNVTIPYKESVIPFLDELDETAKIVGAVNCIKMEPGLPAGQTGNKDQKSRLTGFNTDVFGFRQSIKPFLENHHERALIMGTGGASKAVEFVLKEIGIDCYFVSRDKNEVSGIRYQDKKIFSYDELNEYVLNAFKLIVNTTPVGMFPNINEAPQLPYDLISPSHLLYDLVYNPAETEFLKRGKEKGALIVNGLSMLHQQAEEAWRIWNK